MFGHLKPEEFINAMEGNDLVTAGIAKDRLAHLNSCAVCTAQLRSLETVRNELALEDATIPEPDWNDFRDSVRRELLSRSVQRETTLRRWTGCAIRPAIAWAMSFVLLVGLSIGGFLWHTR